MTYFIVYDGAAILGIFSKKKDAEAYALEHLSLQPEITIYEVSEKDMKKLAS